ncbi:GNAT family N-acetyltransferase [Rhodospirillaceae bacterium]|nr:GNAT family N-acetyltransferase [Rhodospirillaceae bacterium]
MDDWNRLLPIELKGASVKLIPLNLSHAEDLKEAVADGQLNNLWYTNIPDEGGVEAEIERRLKLQKLGSMAPFSVVELKRDKAVGMTTFMNMDPINRRVEIGSTWYRDDVQRTSINTESKLLLMGYAFEKLNCIAVEFRTHFINRQSRRAIERLGAKLDGILRSHMIIANGTIRDTVVYSVIRSEWEVVKANLKWMLKR